MYPKGNYIRLYSSMKSRWILKKLMYLKNKITLSIIFFHFSSLYSIVIITKKVESIPIFKSTLEVKYHSDPNAHLLSIYNSQKYPATWMEDSKFFPPVHSRKIHSGEKFGSHGVLNADCSNSYDLLLKSIQISLIA